MGEILRSSPDDNNFHPHQVEAGLTRLQAYANDPGNRALALVGDQIQTRRWRGIVIRSGGLALHDDTPQPNAYSDPEEYAAGF